jgi:glycosyltransferase involved in cell wall biosynthesis
MNLLLLNQYYPPDTAPTGRYLHDLAKALVQRGHQVTVFCSRRAYNGTAVYLSEETVDGVHVQRVRASGFGRRSAAGKFVDYASFYFVLAGQLLSSRLKPDLVVSLTTPPYVGFLARWKRKTAQAHWIMDLYPDVLAAHGALSPTSLVYRVLERLTRLELQDSALVVALGEDMADRVRRYLPRSGRPDVPLKHLPLWSDPALTPWSEQQPPGFRREQGWTEQDRVFMYSGNMGRGHRLGEFLRVAVEGRKDPTLHWVFAGGGKRCEEVEEAMRQHQDARLRLLPYAPYGRLREHLCSADVHLASLDTAWQGCMVPSKIQGIFAVGKPVIFVGGEINSLARWIIESGGGWVVPENDLPALRNAVEAARDATECERRGKAARAFAENHFNRDDNIRHLAELLETHAHLRKSR